MNHLLRIHNSVIVMGLNGDVCSGLCMKVYILYITEDVL